MQIVFGKRITGVEINGEIGVQPLIGERFITLFRKLKKHENTRSVLLKVDSGGGTVIDSDAIYQGVADLVQEKPVVSYVSGICASGAYLAVCPSTKIVAMPSAIVGSIGVISQNLNVANFFYKLGLKVYSVKRGELKEAGTPYRKPKREETENIQKLVDEIYADFTLKVKLHRSIDQERIEQIATGEVFTARHAQQLGLIDSLGTYYDAVKDAMNYGNLKKEKVKFVKPKKTWGERLSMTSKLQSIILNTLSDLNKPKLKMKYI